MIPRLPRGVASPGEFVALSEGLEPRATYCLPVVHVRKAGVRPWRIESFLPMIQAHNCRFA
jgi:hypothetical protein